MKFCPRCNSKLVRKNNHEYCESETFELPLNFLTSDKYHYHVTYSEKTGEIISTDVSTKKYTISANSHDMSIREKRKIKSISNDEEFLKSILVFEITAPTTQQIDLFLSFSEEDVENFLLMQ